MQTIWLHSKMSVPKVSTAIVHRERLYALLREKSASKITVIEAAAGYGKTTILSQWKWQLKEPTAWLSLDIMDNDPNRFFQYVLQSIVYATGYPMDQQLGHLFNLKCMPPSELIIDSLLHELDEMDTRLHVILDDYHHIELDMIHQMMIRLVQYLPDHVHLYIASRRKLPFPIASWRMKCWVKEISMSELAFTYQEIEAVFQKNHITVDKASFCQNVLDRTAGWAAGVQLASVSAERNAGSLQRSAAFASEYIMEEIFTTLAPSTQHFLLQTSLFEVLDPELCNALTNREDSSEQLVELVDYGILTIRLSQEKQAFRYHPLLLEVLEEERQKVYRGEALQELTKKAACLLYNKRDHHMAIEFALKHQLFSLADQWITTNLLDIFNSAQTHLLIQWVDRLRKAAYPVHVETLLIYAISLMNIQEIEKANQAISELDARDKQDGWKDREEYSELVSILLSLKAAVHLAAGELEMFVELITKQVQRGLVHDKWYLAPVQYNPFYAKVTRTSLGGKGKYSDINLHRAFTEWFRQTEFKDQHLMGYSYSMLAEQLYEENQLEEALREVTQGLRYANTFKDRGLYVPLTVLQGKIYMAQGQITAAHAVWDFSIHHVSEWYWQRSIEAMKALAYIRENKLEEAEAVLFRVKRPDSLRIELGQELWVLVYCRLLMAKKAYREALNIVMEVHEYGQGIGQIDIIIEAALLETLCYYHLDQDKVARTTLEVVLALGSRYGYKRLVIDELSTSNILHSYLNNTTNMDLDQQNYLKNLIALQQTSMIRLDKRLGQLTEREKDILRLLISGASNREMAKQLYLSEGTIRVYLTNIYSKLEVKSRTQAILLAKGWEI
ncbi:LuxR C-terminal-related transcriptional regulator [Gracilibacillus timonensis]|uniref:LuxR C-terminal-related transcriptional regulator n=1 Tax=Gracilibacillus timonensis TaxID=1816696 RepID=UPI000826D9CC|nr:LuxR C-terminal-related transcriptional regulator [Gracilibacillus timonensis]